MGWIIDVTAGVLRGAGKPDLADWLKEAPKKLGEEIGRILLEGQQDGGSISTEALAKLEALKNENPVSVTSQPHDLEGEYAADLNAFISRARSGESSTRQTIVAVRGFLHDPTCVAVWIIDATKLVSLSADASAFEPYEKKIGFYSSSLDVYILAPKSDDDLAAMNRAIERDTTQFLKELQTKYLFKVVSITKNTVTLIAPTKPRKTVGEESHHAIENRAGVAEAFRTIEMALSAQSERLHTYRQERSGSGN